MVKRFKKLLAVSLGLCFAANLLCLGAVAADEELASELTAVRAKYEYIHTEFDRSDGILSNTVNAAAQTNDGCIWLATDCGLMRYNANYFETIMFESEDISQCCITSLVCDGEGTLWIGTAANGLFRLVDGKVQFFDTKGYLSQDIVAIECDASGDAVVAAGNGIAVIDSESFEITNLCDELTSADKSLVDISAASNGLVWCVTDNSSVYFVANSQKALVDIDGSDGSGVISTQKPVSVYASSSGRVYVGTASSEIIYFDPCDDGSFDSGIINCDFISCTYSFVEDDLSRVWICTDNGIGYIEDDKVYAFDSRFSGRVNSGFCDMESSLWMCSQDEGLLQLSGNRQVNLSAQAGIGTEICNCVAVYNNLLYIGTNDGLEVYDALNVASVAENELTTLLKGIKINCLITEENGNLLIGTDEKYGFIRYNAGTDRSWSMLNSENGLCGQSVYALCVDKSGSVAVATENGVCIVEGDSVKSVYETNVKVNSLEFDNSGTLFAAAENGVFTVEGNSLKSIDSELADCSVFDMCTVGDSQVLIATSNGLYIFSDSSLKEVCPDVFIDIISDVNGLIYLISDDTVYRTNSQGLINGDDFTDVCGTSGLYASTTIGSKACILKEVLYVCTIDGVIALKTSTPVNKPNLSVNAIYCDGEKTSLDDGVLRLGSHNNTLVIDASVLSYKGECLITYVLEGFDEAERTVPASELIRYTNLDGGKYTLKIYGTDSDGNNTDVITIKISKQNIWYESPVFWIILVLAAAIISFLVSMFFIAEKLGNEEALQSVRANLSLQSIMAVSQTIDSRSNVSAGHSKRVAECALEIAKRLRCDDNFKESLYLAALLHDIGNIGVSDEILKKPHKLSPEELKAMQHHVEIGFSIINEHDALRELADAVLYHHERYDGVGYSKGLKGDEIPLSARIIFASESLDAMMTEKPYRPKLTRERILNEFRVGSGTQFDPEIASVVIKMVESGYVSE
ncbi:MAG: HD domain-containing protein [Oscillospiraceae bacterium]|nr:HD domain-containing protein [Oscillospiraceae bacterium]